MYRFRIDMSGMVARYRCQMASMTSSGMPAFSRRRPISPTTRGSMALIAPRTSLRLDMTPCSIS
jgi:hypothetical protein